jgi:hypothetical protein
VFAAPLRPNALPDEALRETNRPVLVLSAMKDRPRPASAIARCWPIALCSVNGAGAAIGAERPEAFRFIAFQFFERRDLLPVSRERGMTFRILRGTAKGFVSARGPHSPAGRAAGDRQQRAVAGLAAHEAGEADCLGGPRAIGIE